MGKLFPSPGDLPNPGIELRSALQADSLLFEPPVKLPPGIRLPTILSPLTCVFKVLHFVGSRALPSSPVFIIL